MIAGALIAVLVGMALLLIRAFAGPDIYNRILAVNNFGTKDSACYRTLWFPDRPTRLS